MSWAGSPRHQLPPDTSDGESFASRTTVLKYHRIHWLLSGMKLPLLFWEISCLMFIMSELHGWKTRPFIYLEIHPLSKRRQIGHLTTGEVHSIRRKLSLWDIIPGSVDNVILVFTGEECTYQFTGAIAEFVGGQLRLTLSLSLSNFSPRRKRPEVQCFIISNRLHKTCLSATQEILTSRWTIVNLSH